MPEVGEGIRRTAPFFALNLQDADGEVATYGLEGPLDAAEYEGSHGSRAANHGIPRFREEHEFAATCHSLFERGRQWVDEQLFNGEYYEHEIRPVGGPADVADGLYIRNPGPCPILQLGAGCLIDQLVGQYMAHILGLGYLLDPVHVRRAYESIRRYNWRQTFHGHFNSGRSYALGGESALLMASYPKGRRPEQPFPYFSEVMTGFEYTAAIGMLQEGLVDDGLACIQAIRHRYDGRKRSPFNEAECGHHYARAMASWGAIAALTGFHYSAVTGEMRFAASEKPVTWFWSTGYAWGTLCQNGESIVLRVVGGEVRVDKLTVGDRVLAGLGDGIVQLGDTRFFEC
ncbi:MAG: glycoside hydrolase family 116 protein [Candidatus Pacebacteria bacterium]|nr:glycoside hydrolase family 116 protein [Candidatus Paceibacterota bacterium]